MDLHNAYDLAFNDNVCDALKVRARDELERQRSSKSPNSALHPWNSSQQFPQAHSAKRASDFGGALTPLASSK
jgi:hypothetical protein